METTKEPLQFNHWLLQLAACLLIAWTILKLSDQKTTQWFIGLSLHITKATNIRKSAWNESLLVMSSLIFSQYPIHYNCLSSSLKRFKCYCCKSQVRSSYTPKWFCKNISKERQFGSPKSFYIVLLTWFCCLSP